MGGTAVDGAKISPADVERPFGESWGRRAPMAGAGSRNKSGRRRRGRRDRSGKWE